MKIKVGIPKGTRDFLPEDMAKREFVINLIKDVFRRYGFEPLETPSIERLDVLTGKYGEEGEVLIFKILKRGEELRSVLRRGNIEEQNLTDLALRYDLTVPLSRVIAMYQNRIVLPFKRYQIQPVWRAEKPQKGRYREFYQCDVDIVGTRSMFADAEIMRIIYDIFSKLGFSKFVIRFNHRKILRAIFEHLNLPEKVSNDFFISIDKLDKIGIEGVKEELKKRGLEEVINKVLPILEIRGEIQEVLNAVKPFIETTNIGMEAIKETEDLIKFIKYFEIPEDYLRFDLYLVRGLEYYTGPIYETVVEEPKIGSLSGGGRYDKLIGMFLGREIPATGTTIGLERIIDVMNELGMLNIRPTTVQILVTVFNEQTLPYSIKLTQFLRNNGFYTEIFFDFKKSLSRQFKYANSKKIPVTLVLGPDEIESNKVTIKFMETKEQITVNREDLIEKLKYYFKN